MSEPFIFVRIHGLKEIEYMHWPNDLESSYDRKLT